jgi:hypothetical protein
MSRLSWISEAQILEDDVILDLEVIGAFVVIFDLGDPINDIENFLPNNSCLNEGLNVGGQTEDHEHASHKRDEHS